MSNTLIPKLKERESEEDLCLLHLFQGIPRAIKYLREKVTKLAPLKPNAVIIKRAKSWKPIQLLHNVQIWRNNQKRCKIKRALRVQIQLLRKEPSGDNWVHCPRSTTSVTTKTTTKLFTTTLTSVAKKKENSNQAWLRKFSRSSRPSRTGRSRSAAVSSTIIWSSSWTSRIVPFQI